MTMTTACVVRKTDIPVDAFNHIFSYIRHDTCIVCQRETSFQYKPWYEKHTMCSVVCHLKYDVDVHLYFFYLLVRNTCVYTLYTASFLLCHLFIIVLWFLAVSAQIYMVALMGYNLIIRVKLMEYFVCLVEWIAIIEAIFSVKLTISG